MSDTATRKVGLIVEDPAKVVPVGEYLEKQEVERPREVGQSVVMSTNLRLPWQIRPAAVHQVDAGQPIFAGDFLCSEVLLDGHGVVGPTFDCGVIGHNHALRPVDSTDAGDDSGRGNLSKSQGGYSKSLQL